MGLIDILCSSIFLFTLVEATSKSGTLWPLKLGMEFTGTISWTVFSSSIFMFVALVLSTYLIFEHLAAYNQPEVFSLFPLLLDLTYLSSCTNKLRVYVMPSFPFLTASYNCTLSTDLTIFLLFITISLPFILFSIYMYVYVYVYSFLDSGAEVFDWSHLNGSCLFLRIGKGD